MANSRKDDVVLAFDNYTMEVVADASDVKPAGVTSPVVCDVTAGKRRGRFRSLWHRVYWLLSSAVGLVLLLFIYTLIGAAVLNYTEHDRELQLHAELDDVRRRVVANIVNLTTTESRDPQSDDVTTAGSRDIVVVVDGLVVEYGDARESLRPSSKSPGWTFTGALFFCVTVYTTIGYGNVSPVTTVGRVVTIIYGLIGIPLCLAVLASVGKLLTRAIKYFWKFVRRFYYTGSCRRVRRVIPVSRLRMTLLQRMGYQLTSRTRRFRQAIRRRKPAAEQGDSRQRSEEEDCVPYEVDDNFNLPPVVAVMIGITYALLGALTYTSWEQWTYFEAFYFTCVSLSTIGFGDVVPDHPKYFLAFCVYLIVGLALLAMIINVLMAAMHVTVTKATTRVMQVGQRLSQGDVLEQDDTQQPQQQPKPPPPSLHRHSTPISRRRSV